MQELLKSRIGMQRLKERVNLYRGDQIAALIVGPLQVCQRPGLVS